MIRFNLELIGKANIIYIALIFINLGSIILSDSPVGMLPLRFRLVDMIFQNLMQLGALNLMVFIPLSLWIKEVKE